MRIRDVSFPLGVRSNYFSPKEVCELATMRINLSTEILRSPFIRDRDPFTSLLSSSLCTFLFLSLRSFPRKAIPVRGQLEFMLFLRVLFSTTGISLTGTAWFTVGVFLLGRRRGLRVFGRISVRSFSFANFAF